MLLKDQVNDDAAHNKYLPPSGSGNNQKGVPPSELHAGPITQLLYLPEMYKDKYLSVSKDNTLKLWRTRTLQHMRTMHLGEATGWINASLHLPDVKRFVLASALGKLLSVDPFPDPNPNPNPNPNPTPSPNPNPNPHQARRSASRHWRTLRMRSSRRRGQWRGS